LPPLAPCLSVELLQLEGRAYGPPLVRAEVLADSAILGHRAQIVAPLRTRRGDGDEVDAMRHLLTSLLRSRPVSASSQPSSDSGMSSSPSRAERRHPLVKYRPHSASLPPTTTLPVGDAARDQFREQLDQLREQRVGWQLGQPQDYATLIAEHMAQHTSRRDAEVFGMREANASSAREYHKALIARLGANVPGLTLSPQGDSGLRKKKPPPRLTPAVGLQANNALALRKEACLAKVPTVLRHRRAEQALQSPAGEKNLSRMRPTTSAANQVEAAGLALGLPVRPPPLNMVGGWCGAGPSNPRSWVPDVKQLG
jgi:hypothetical protein